VVSDKPTVIFLNRFFYPDHSATSQLLTDVATALAARGMRVKVIASRLLYDKPHETLVAREVVRGVEVVRIATSGFGRGNLVGRAFDYLTFYLSAAWTLYRHARRYDVIVAKTDPPMLSIVVAPVAWLRGARYINWLQDIFPEVAEAIRLGRGQGKFAFSALKGLRNVSLRRAHLNIVLGDRMAERVTSLGVPVERICVIPNWADGQLIRWIDPRHNRLRQQWGLAHAFVIGYSGNLGRAHDIDTFLDAIAYLEGAGAPSNGSAVPDMRWVFIGGGALSQRLRAEASKRGLRTVQFRPYQSRERLSESLSVADIHLISLRPELEGLIVPSKYYGIAAAGRPAIFIGDGDGEIARLLRDSNTGTIVAEGDGTGLAKAICAYADNPQLGTAQGLRARQLFEERFDISHALGAWQRVVNDVWPASSSPAVFTGVDPCASGNP
jgi:colanic acid biosynthesis glycosyl transferase WcaI